MVLVAVDGSENCIAGNSGGSGVTASVGRIVCSETQHERLIVAASMVAMPHVGEVAHELGVV